MDFDRKLEAQRARTKDEARTAAEKNRRRREYLQGLLHKAADRAANDRGKAPKLNGRR